MKKINQKSMVILTIVAILVFSNFVVIPSAKIVNLENNENKSILSITSPSWPTSWVQIDNDPNEDGSNDNYRDVEYAYYTFDSDYLYLRLQCYDTAAFKSGGRDGRFKWFLDIDSNGYFSGQNIHEGEYLLFVEDMDDDTIGEVYFLADTDNDGMFSEWESPPDYYSGGLVTDTSIAHYRLLGNNADLYINLTSIGNPTESSFIWATDQENPNLEQGPTTDCPDTVLGPFPLIESPDINLEKQVWNASSSQWEDNFTANIGDDIQFRIIITNTGKVTLNNIEVEDDLPSFLTYNYDSSPAHSSATDHHIEWNLGTINVGATQTIIFSAEAISEGEDDNLAEACGVYFVPEASENKLLTIFDNSLSKFNAKSKLSEMVQQIFKKLINFIKALIDDMTPPPTDTICDSDTAHVIVTTAPNPNIEIIKKVWNGTDWADSASFTVGEDIDFKLLISNTGNLDLNLFIEDDLPNFLTYNYDANYTPTSALDHHIEWHDIIILGAGKSVEIIFSAHADAEGENNNFASVDGYYEQEQPSVSDSDTAHVIITTCPNPDVEIIKKVWNGASWVDSASFYVGDDVEFKLVVTNRGNVALESFVHVDDTLPSFLSFNDDANLTPTSASDHYIEWHDLAPLSVDESIEIIFSAHADAVGEGNNIADVEGQFDSMAAVSDSDNANVIVSTCPGPNINVIKKVWNGTDWTDTASFYLGDDVQFQIIVTNTGNVVLDNYVHVDDYLPIYLTYNYDANLTPTSTSDHYIEWHDLAPLAVGASVEITFSAHAESEGDSYNSVEVEGKYDCTPPVFHCDVAHIIVECTPTPNPDVDVEKKVWNGASWVDSATFDVGDDIEFKITVTNTGNVVLDNYVHVDDDLPSFLTYNYDANPTPTSASDHHIEWHNLAPLAVSASVEITFSAHADSTGESDNAVAVEAKYDCNPPVDDCDLAHVIVEEGCEDEPPVTTKEYGRPFYSNCVDDWITTTTPIWLNATDYPILGSSGVYQTYYRISKWNGVSWDVEIDWTVYTGPFNIPSECKHKIEFYSEDNCCNQEEIKWQIVFVDDTPPASAYKVTHDPAHYVCRVSTMTITAEDKGLCAVGDYTIYVYVDGEFYKKANNKKVSFQFNEYYGFGNSGSYQIKFWAEDALGNKETPHIETFIIDNQGPSVSKSFIGPHEYIDYHWNIEPSTQIKLTASDSGVGVDYIKYRIGTSSEGGSWNLYTGPFTTDKENIYYYASDKLGNTGGLHHLFVTIVDEL